jgi:hypothetical protein
MDTHQGHTKELLQCTHTVYLPNRCPLNTKPNTRPSSISNSMAIPLECPPGLMHKYNRSHRYICKNMAEVPFHQALHPMATKIDLVLSTLKMSPKALNRNTANLRPR